MSLLVMVTVSKQIPTTMKKDNSFLSDSGIYTTTVNKNVSQIILLVKPSLFLTRPPCQLGQILLDCNKNTVYLKRAVDDKLLSDPNM